MKLTAHKTLLGLILFLLALFLLQILSPEAFDPLMMTPLLVERAWDSLLSGNFTELNFATLSTFLTAALLHGSWSHLIFNVLYLWIFAGLIGELLGTRWMLAIFLITALGGSMGDLILRRGSDIPYLGASGAVLGFQGAYLGLAVKWPLPHPSIWPISYPIPPLRLLLLAAVGIVFDITNTIEGSTGTAYGAHFGGFLTGLFLTSFIAGTPRKLA